MVFSFGNEQCGKCCKNSPVLLFILFSSPCSLTPAFSLSLPFWLSRSLFLSHSLINTFAFTLFFARSLSHLRSRVRDFPRAQAGVRRPALYTLPLSHTCAFTFGSPSNLPDFGDLATVSIISKHDRCSTPLLSLSACLSVRPPVQTAVRPPGCPSTRLSDHSAVRPADRLRLGPHATFNEKLRKVHYGHSGGQNP